MAENRRTITAGQFAAALSLGLLLAAGCNNSSSGTRTPPSGGPGGPGGPGGTSTMSGGGGRPGGGPGGAQVAATATGAEILQQKCGCHGPGGKNGKAPALTGGAGKSEEELIKIIHDGKGKMPTFASQLTDDQIKLVAAEVKSLK